MKHEQFEHGHTNINHALGKLIDLCSDQTRSKCRAEMILLNRISDAYDPQFLTVTCHGFVQKLR